MEVETKVQLGEGDLAKLTHYLSEHDIHLGDASEQRDVYFKEPGFRSRVQGPGSYLVRVRYTDRATTLNMKRLTTQDGVWEETETKIESGQTAEVIILALGAEPAVVVVKRRQAALDGRVEINIDSVDGLGDFLELAIETDEGTADARDELNRYLTKIGIASARQELKGYPTILLEREGVVFSAK